MGLVVSEVSSGGCWKRSERRVSWEGERTALSPLSADTSLHHTTKEGVELGMKGLITAGGRSQD